MQVTISGPPGSGTSTVAAALAETLGHEHISGGEIFREMAAERGVSALELNRMLEGDGDVDRELDSHQRELAEERDDLILESRLAGWMAGENADLRVWLDAPLAVRTARIAEREDISIEEAREDTVNRVESESQRYRNFYGIEIEDRSIYDLVIGTSRWSAEAVIRIVSEAAETFDSADDEESGRRFRTIA